MTDGPTIGGGNRAVSRSVRFFLFNTLVLTSGVVLWATGVQHATTVAAAPHLALSLAPWVLFVVAFTATYFSAEVTFGRYTMTVNALPLPLIMALFLVPPAQFLLAYTSGAFLASVAYRGFRPLLDYGNAGFDALDIGLAYVVAQHIGFDAHDPLSPRGLLLVGVVMLFVCRGVNPILFHTCVWICNREQSWPVIARGYVFAFFSECTHAALAIIALSLLIGPNPYLVLAFVPPLALVSIGAIVLGEGLRRAQRMEVLYKISDILHADAGIDLELRRISDLLRSMFGSASAEVVLAPRSTGAAVIYASHSETDASALGAVRELDVTELGALGALSQSGSAAAGRRSERSGLLASLLRERGAQRGLAALLGDEHHVLGMLVIVDTEYSGRRTRRRDLEILELAAGKVSAAVDKAQLVGALDAISEQNAHLTQQVLHDPLTGLANRSLFVDRTKHALSRFARSRQAFAILFLDLDGFKAVNDTLGHAAGDAVLRVVAERLLVHLRKPDTAARLGGDEFAVLLEDLSDVVDAPLIAGRIVAALADPVGLEQGVAHVSASVGVAVVDDHEDIPALKDLLDRADTAMYFAKAHGKNRYAVFDQISARPAFGHRPDGRRSA